MKYNSTQIRAYRMIKAFKADTTNDKKRLEKASDLLFADITNTDLGFKADSGLAGKVAEILGHDSDSTITRVQKQGATDLYVIIDGKRRYGACIGGMVSVVNGEVTLVPTTFEWAESIDAARAEASQKRAETVLHKKDASDTEVQLAQARLHRALVRKSVASYK